jgi:CheY-like chemotaxis protein
MSRQMLSTDNYPNLLGKRIIVVEDDVVIAVDYAFQLRAVGALAEAFEPSNEAALEYLATHDIDAAIVDYHLRDGPCHPLLQMLERRHIPFVVVTGDSFDVGGGVERTQVLAKPVASAALSRALSEAVH